MKAAVIQKPGEIIVKDVPKPVPKDDEVLIRVKAAGICGTDVHIFKGEYLGSYPIIPGHEFSGVVEQVGSKVTRIKKGDHVAVEPNIACDNCSACLNNRQNFCNNWNAVGVSLPGGFAEYTTAPEKAVFSIGNLDFISGAFVEPLSCVLHGVEKTSFRLGDRVLIIGAGPIGILLSKAIQIQGAFEITQVDKNPARLALAKSCGADKTETSLESLEHCAYDVVVDATGVPALMEKTLLFARKGGKILLFGVPPNNATITFPAFTIFQHGLTILSSYTSVRNSMQAVNLLSSGKIDVKPVVSHVLPLEQFAEGIDLIQKGVYGVLKVLIEP